MQKITIFTTFVSADYAYSLNRIVIDQLKMLTMGGYEVKVIAHEGFKGGVTTEEAKRDLDKQWYNHPKVEIVEIPNVPVSNDSYVDETFEEDISKLKEALKPIFLETDVCITHDLVYQPAALKHNLAVRRLLKECPEIKTKFLHWIHSATKPDVLSSLRGGNQEYLNLIQSKFPRSFYITFNQFSVPRLKEWFKVDDGDIKYVPHPHDFFEGKDPLTMQIAQKTNILQKDVACMYPCRLDRGKQPEYVIKIMHAVKESGRSICCIIADFHSTDGDKVTYRNEMKNLGMKLGFNSEELVFLSEFEMEEGKFRYEVPHRVISELFEFTNTFILPSKSETYSLIAQEAAAKRNFVILNHDFPPFRSIYGDAPYYRQFSSNIDSANGMDGETNTRFADEKEYWKEVANYIGYVQDHTRVLALHNKIRQERNLSFVFRRHIEPLFVVEPASFDY